MNNRVLAGILVLVTAFAIIFGLVQSQNLTQSQVKLAEAQTAAASTLSAAELQAADAQSQALTLAAQTASTRQAQMMETSNAQAATSQAGQANEAATAQSQVLASAQQLASTQQAQVVATSQSQASSTLTAAVANAATHEAGILNEAATAQAQAITSAQQLAATQHANAVATIVAEARSNQENLIATQTMLEGQLSDLQALMEKTIIPTVTPVATEPLDPEATSDVTHAADQQTPQQLCDAVGTAKNPENRNFNQAEQVLQLNVDYFAILCTGAGPVFIDLLEKETPITVNNFVFLAQQGYYNNTTFHRVLPNFMAQGGDPTGSGTGDPGYSFIDEIIPSLTFDAPGKLAMANAGPNTNGSQFFITFGPQPTLNGGYTIFGLVVKGQANVNRIKLRDPEQNPTTSGTPLNTVLIITDQTKVLLTDNPLPTQTDVAKALEGVDTLITTELANTLENIKLSQSTAEVVSDAPEAARKDLETLLTSNNHRYRVSSTLNNKACDISQLSFYFTSYILDAFASGKDAAAAIADPAMEKIALESGYTDKVTSANLTYPYYTTKDTICGKPVVRAMTYWRRGNFIVTTQVAWPIEAQGIDVLDQVLAQFVGARLYEPLLTTVLYSEIQ